LLNQNLTQTPAAGPVDAKKVSSLKSKKKDKRRMQSSTTSAKDKWKEKKKIGLTPEDMIRKYKFSYPLVIYSYKDETGTMVSRNLTETDVLYDLNIYFKKILNREAGNDTYTYPRLIGTDWESPSIRAMFFYRERKLTYYKIDFPNP
jgi:hypothetical protein